MNTKNYAVLRIDKIHSLGELAGKARHNLRISNVSHANKNKENIYRGLGTIREITGAWRDITNGLAIKSTSVLAVEYVITTTHEFWETATKEQKKAWVKRSYDFVSAKHGAENILSAALHLDERTPHWHVLVVPIDTKPRIVKKMGRPKAGEKRKEDKTLKPFRGLNAAAFFDGSEMMSKLQDDYYATVGDLGLIRGVKGSKARHKTVRDFHKGLKVAEQPMPNLTKADYALAAVGVETSSLQNHKKAVAGLQWASKAPEREQSAMRKVKELAKAKREAEEAKTDAEKDKVRADARSEALKRETVELKQQLSLANEIIVEKDSALESQAVELQYLKQKDSKVLPFARHR